MNVVLVNNPPPAGRLFEDGASPFLRAAQSGDVALMKLLLDHGADPKI